MIVVKTSVSLSFGDWLRGRESEAAVAVSAAIRAAGEGLRTDLRQALGRSGVKPVVGNFIGLKLYPANQPSLGAAAWLYGRGQQAQTILASLAEARVVRPARGGRFIAIPTGFNHASGWRGRGNTLITPKQMAALKGMTFTRPIRSGPAAGGGKLWFLRVSEASRKNRNGNVQRLAFVNLPSGARLLGSGRRRRTDAIFAPKSGVAGAVPMFILLPSVAITQKFRPVDLAQSWLDRIPGLIERALPGGAT